jgi:putative hydrolase of the HAD superfamily
MAGRATHRSVGSFLLHYNPLMSNRRFSAITLDAGNTLLYCDPSPPEIYAHHLSRHGPRVGADEVGPVFAEAWAEMQQRTPSGSDRYSSHPGGEREWWGAFVREVLQRLSHPAPWRPLLDDLYAAFAAADVWHAFPDTVDTLTRLTELGVPLAVISNWDRRLPEILQNLALADFFQVVTVSSLAGAEKPSEEIFSLTLDGLGVPAGETVHVGDSPRDDYSGAERAGLIPVLIDRYRAFTDNGYRRIESLSELVEMVE